MRHYLRALTFPLALAGCAVLFVLAALALVFAVPLMLPWHGLRDKPAPEPSGKLYLTPNPSKAN